MLVERMVSYCDFTDRKYQSPVKGAAVISCSATGHYCEVTWMGPEYIASSGSEPITYEQAKQQIGNTGKLDF